MRHASTAIAAAAAFFATSVTAALDPIVIKVHEPPGNQPLPRRWFCIIADIRGILGLKILLQDKWDRIVSLIGMQTARSYAYNFSNSFIKGVAYQRP